jgi:hypothetical protein
MNDQHLRHSENDGFYMSDEPAAKRVMATAAQDFCYDSGLPGVNLAGKTQEEIDQLVAERDATAPVVVFTPTVVEDNATDEERAQRARERDEISITERPLLEFFTRRETDWWLRKDRSKYHPHVGASQLLRADSGMSRSAVRDAVYQFHKERAVATAERTEAPRGEE